MIDNQLQNAAFSYGNFTWWFGVVEGRNDPKKLGRVQVRILGYHSAQTQDISSEKLLWAYPIQPITSAGVSGIGTTPTGLVESSWVFGFFRDGITAQDPIIMGAIAGIPSSKKQSDDGDGFSDPNDIYPREDFLQESDLNRLARNEKIEETTIQKQKDGEDKNVPIALKGNYRQETSYKWDEKQTSYNAIYPFNHVKETESGHQEEWDDTKGFERYRRWHKCGTFTEEHPDGDVVKKVKKDNYSLIMGKDFIHVIGDCMVTIGAGTKLATIESDDMEYEDNIPGEKPDWDKNRKVDSSSLSLLIKGDANVEVEENFNLKVHGDYNLYVKGEIHEKSDGISFRDSKEIRFNDPVSPTNKLTQISDPEWE